MTTKSNVKDAMKIKLSQPLWNLLAVIFAGGFFAAAFYLLCGNASAMVRMTLAVCGFASLWAGQNGGIVRGVGVTKALSAMRRNAGCLTTVFVLGAIVVAILAPVFLQVRDYARRAAISSDLKREGLSLIQYAQSHKGYLPPQTGRGQVYRDIRSTFVPGRDYGRPFVWCADLGGLRWRDVKKPEAVVAAYSVQPRRSYLVLFLDGHIRSRGKTDLDEALRERPALLAPALAAKAKRGATSHGSRRAATSPDQ